MRPGRLAAASYEPADTREGREFLRTPLGSLIGEKLERGGPGWELNTSLRVTAAVTSHLRNREIQFLSTLMGMPSYNQDRVDALRGVILPWIRTVSKQDIIDETMSSTLIGKKLKVDWDKVPKTFRKRRIISDDKERGFWKKKRELPR